MARYRVGEGGIRVTTNRGAVYSLPPGAVVDEIPHHYEGTLEVIEWERVQPSEPDPPPCSYRVSSSATDVEWKRVDGYADKMVRPAEAKSL